MKDLKTSMMEKYLHSQGAALYEAGRLDEAILFLHRAVALEDHSYTRHDLSRTFREKGDLNRAIRENDRAIALDPYAARYYYERSELQHLTGNESGARLDSERAMRLDANYSRIEEVWHALKVLEESVFPAEITGSCREEQISDPRLNDALSALPVSSGRAHQSLESVSCPLPCPAYCCHFEGSPLLHGLSIGPWKLLKIKEMLRDRGLREEDFLDRIELTGEQEIQNLIRPDHLLRERLGAYVYAPKEGKSLLSAAFVACRPKGRDYQDLVWINAKSRACSFLHEDRCMIHDLGDELALPACKEFLCLTGFVFVLLARWDLVEPETIAGKSMEQLNRAAIDSAIMLSAELCRADDLNRIRTSLEEAVSDALRADREGNAKRVEHDITRIGELNRSFAKTFMVRKAMIRRKVAEMLDS
jgi:hypothetical protein